MERLTFVKAVLQEEISQSQFKEFMSMSRMKKW